MELGSMRAQAEKSRSLTLLDLPKAVLQDILSRCGPGETRTGICLALVCKDFHGALLDLQHVRLWGTVAPLSCVQEHMFDACITPERMQAFRQWLQARASAMRALHIKRQTNLRDTPHWELPPWPQAMPNLTELVVDMPGAPVDPTEKWMLAPLASLTSLRCLRLSFSFGWQPNESGWGWLQELQHLTSIHLHNHTSQMQVTLAFDMKVLGQLRMLEEVTIRVDHTGDMAPLAGLPALRSLTLSLPKCGYVRYVSLEELAGHWEGICGLTSLHELALLPPGDARDFDEGYPTMPSDAALRHLTKLTCLQLQVAGVEPANGSIQPSITRLHRLARLRVGGTLEGNVCELPAGFGSLTALTFLSFYMVHFSPGGTLQAGLEALEVLEAASCSGTLCIACPLPALQRLSIADSEDLLLHPAFVSALRSQPDTRCEVTAAWFWGEDVESPSMLPLAAVQLPRMHSLVICNPPSWRGFARAVYLDHLEDMDLQGCGLHSIPAQLRSATRLQHLRIGGDGDVLRIVPADLEPLSAMRSLTFLSLAKPNPPHGACAPRVPFEMRVAWDGPSLQTLCCILWELRARSLTVVLREPSDVVVSLATAAALPADALGRCALTTRSVAGRFQGTLPWDARSNDGAAAVWAWLNEAFPQHAAPFDDIAELDGAAAMRAAVPCDATDWLQLLRSARGLS